TEKQNVFQQQELRLKHEDKTWNIPVADLDLKFDNDSAIDEAYSRGKRGGMSNQVGEFLASLVKKTKIRTEIEPLSESVQEKLSEKVLKDIETPVSETSLAFVPGKVEIVPGTAGKKLEYES